MKYLFLLVVAALASASASTSRSLLGFFHEEGMQVDDKTVRDVLALNLSSDLEDRDFWDLYSYALDGLGYKSKSIHVEFLNEILVELLDGDTVVVEAESDRYLHGRPLINIRNEGGSFKIYDTKKNTYEILSYDLLMAQLSYVIDDSFLLISTRDLSLNYDRAILSSSLPSKLREDKRESSGEIVEWLSSGEGRYPKVVSSIQIDVGQDIFDVSLSGDWDVSDRVDGDCSCFIGEELIVNEDGLNILKIYFDRNKMPSGDVFSTGLIIIPDGNESERFTITLNGSFVGGNGILIDTDEIDFGIVSSDNYGKSSTLIGIYDKVGNVPIEVEKITVSFDERVRVIKNSSFNFRVPLPFMPVSSYTISLPKPKSESLGTVEHGFLVFRIPLTDGEVIMKRIPWAYRSR